MALPIGFTPTLASPRIRGIVGAGPGLSYVTLYPLAGCTGSRRRRPRATPCNTAEFFTPGYGRRRQCSNTSHAVMPNDHTSDLVVSYADAAETDAPPLPPLPPFFFFFFFWSL